MTEQLQLPLRQRRTQQDRARDDADQLVAWLASRPDYARRPAADIAEALAWTDRRLRAAAEASEGRILSAPGLTGYRLAASASVASYYATERPRYLAQIQDMQHRLLQMDRAVHLCAAPAGRQP